MGGVGEIVCHRRTNLTKVIRCSYNDRLCRSSSTSCSSGNGHGTSWTDIQTGNGKNLQASAIRLSLVREGLQSLPQLRNLPEAPLFC